MEKERGRFARFRAVLFGLALSVLMVFALVAVALLALFVISVSRAAAGTLPTAYASHQGVISPSASMIGAPSATPFQPRTYTPTPSPSPTATLTPSPTTTPTATVTLTPLPTSTLTPTPTPEPTATPTASPIPPTPAPESDLPTGELPTGELPEAARIEGVYGAAQALPLSCEARSAVDWARFFGARIGEMEFQNALPQTLNPNTGFVGSPSGERGGIPPRDYGVHAAPVAGLLRAYGLSARSDSGLVLDDLRREIAAGRPVIAWVVGNVWNGYSGTHYTAPDGETLLVAAFEHTVIVTAYDASTVTVVDNDMRYSVAIERFLDSWAALGNMAIRARGE